MAEGALLPMRDARQPGRPDLPATRNRTAADVQQRVSDGSRDLLTCCIEASNMLIFILAY